MIIAISLVVGTDKLCSNSIKFLVWCCAVIEVLRTFILRAITCNVFSYWGGNVWTMVLFKKIGRPSRVAEAWMAALVLSDPRLVFEPMVAAWNIAREAESTEFSPLRILRSASVQWHFDVNWTTFGSPCGLTVRKPKLTTFVCKEWNLAHLFARKFSLDKNNKVMSTLSCLRLPSLCDK